MHRNCVVKIKRVITRRAKEIVSYKAGWEFFIWMLTTGNSNTLSISTWLLKKNNNAGLIVSCVKQLRPEYTMPNDARWNSSSYYFYNPLCHFLTPSYFPASLLLKERILKNWMCPKQVHLSSSSSMVLKLKLFILFVPSFTALLLGHMSHILYSISKMD